MKFFLLLFSLFFLGDPKSIQAEESYKDYLVKVSSKEVAVQFLYDIQGTGAEIEYFQFSSWIRVKYPSYKFNQQILDTLKNHPDVVMIQPNYPIKIMENASFQDPEFRTMIQELAAEKHPLLNQKAAKTDNPEIPAPGRTEGRGVDPQLANQWGMQNIGVKEAWTRTTGSKDMIVAVIDTGVDYTHEDLVTNLWRNPGESGVDKNGLTRNNNGQDDDGNGFIDDEIGWDFVSNDNRPYDLSSSMMDIVLKGGNPGHGTHCAGNVAARMDNGKGIAGVAPNVKIMSLRFLSDKGQGTTADAIKAIEYAVKNGARVLSNSWGSEGEDPNDSQGNQALKDAISFSEQQGVLFIAAAGNGHQGRGYDNDTDSRPAYPASYDMENIVSVAAINNQDQLGPFSNWGARSVDIAAPGVKILSTVPGNLYQDTVIDLFGMKVTWDGTSMATPHVAGAAALYWSLYPDKSWRQIKSALLSSATKIPALSGKSVSGGKLNVKSLILGN